MRATTQWTERQLRYLRRFGQVLTAGQLAIALRKSVSDILNQANKQNIKLKTNNED